MSVKLEARKADRARVAAGQLPAIGELQQVSHLWGLRVGVPNAWLPSSLGALLLSRIIDDSPSGRWNAEHRGKFESNAHQIHPNALIWEVNDVIGDIP